MTTEITPAHQAILERVKQITYARQINWITSQPQDSELETTHQAELKCLSESLTQHEPVATKQTLLQRFFAWMERMKI